jgi:hypothetical protein
MGQATMQPLFDHRAPVAPRKRKSSSGRVLALMVLVVVGVAGYVYGPRYYPELKEMVGVQDVPAALAPTTVPGSSLADLPLGVSVPTGELDQGLLLQALKEMWPMLPATDRHGACGELLAGGTDAAVRDFMAGWKTAAAARQSSIPTPSKATVAEFLVWSCDPAGGGG